MGFQGGSVGKNPPVDAGNPVDTGSIPGSGRSPGGINGALVFLPEKFHGQRSLVATVRGVTESDMTEQQSTHAHT